MKKLVVFLSMVALLFTGIYAQEQEKAQQKDEGTQKRQELNELKERILKRVEERLKVEQEKILEEVRQLLDTELAQLAKKEEVAKVEEKLGYLGIKTAPLTNELKTQVGYEGENGIIIVEVFPNTPAARIGLMPGDIIQGLNDETVNEVEKFRTSLLKYKAGEFVTLKFWRQGNDLTMKVKLAPRPEQPAQQPVQVQQPPQPQVPPQQPPQQLLPDKVKCMICGKEMGLDEAKTHRHEVQLKCTICGKTLQGEEAKTHHHHIQPQQMAGPGYLGVQLAELDDEKKKELKYDDDGVLMEKVQENSPADNAGLKEGDIVVAINSEYISSLQELRSIIANKRAGETITLTVWRNRKERDIEVTLAPMIEKQTPPQRRQPQIQPKEEDEEDNDEDNDDNYKGALQQRIEGFLKRLNDEAKKEVKNVSSPKPYLGIQVQQSKEGLSITKVVEDSPAQKAGLTVGDTLKSINGVALENEDILRNLMEKSSPNSKVNITVSREGKEFAIETTLGIRQ